MCVRPIFIKNPKIKAGTFHNNYQPSHMYVPCGHCYECLLSKQNEWIARNYEQYKVSKCSYYYTLTYNEDSILKFPNINQNQFDVVSNKFKNGFSLTPVKSFTRVFNPILVHKFLKRVSMRFKRKDIRFHYFFVSELGDKTERPHHHALFYLDKYVSPIEFENIISACWTYGFYKTGDNFGLVNSPYAIYYVCKYISKGGKKKTFKPFQSTPLAWRVSSLVNRRFGNFRRNSAGLGWHNNIKLLESNLIDGTYKLPFDGKYKSFPIPEYYKRKLIKESFINKNGNVSYRPNSYGWSLMEQTFWSIYDKLQDRCELINERFNTNYSADEILQYRLCNSLPLKCLKFSFLDLFCQRKINNGYIDPLPYSEKNRYFLDEDSVKRLNHFNKLTQILSYQNYEKNASTYNLKQRLTYGRNKKEVKILNFSDYVYSAT